MGQHRIEKSDVKKLFLQEKLKAETVIGIIRALLYGMGLIFNLKAPKKGVFPMGNRSFLISRKQNAHGETFITGVDITREIELEKNLIQRQKESEKMKEKLLTMIRRNEGRREINTRNQAIESIRKAIDHKVKHLDKELREICDKPPEDYEPIISRYRQILQEIRTIVSRWRRLTRREA